MHAIQGNEQEERLKALFLFVLCKKVDWWFDHECQNNRWIENVAAKGKNTSTKKRPLEVV